jgi:hypothetical protein
MSTIQGFMTGASIRVLPLGLHLPHLPGIPGWVKGLFGNVGSFVTDPIGYTARALQAVYGAEAWFFELIIVHPIRFSNAEALDYLYGNAAGLALSLIPAVFITLLCLSIFMHRFVLSLVEITIIGGVLLSATSLWFVLTDEAMSWGDQLAGMAMFYNTHSREGILGLGIDSTVSPLLVIPALFFTSIFGAANVFLVYAYEALNVFIRFAGLPLLVLRPLHPRIARLSDWCFSAGMVTMVFGRFVMVLCIEIGQVLGATVFGGSVAGTVFFVCAGLGISLYLQFKMFQEAKAIVGRVKASIRGQVAGKVDATLRNKPKVSVADHNRLSSQTITPIPVVIRSDGGKKGLVSKGTDIVRSEIHHETRSRVREGVKKVSTGLVAAGATVATGGTAGVAAATGAMAAAGAKPTGPRPSA